jgi:hypothetical protein
MLEALFAQLTKFLQHLLSHPIKTIHLSRPIKLTHKKALTEEVRAFDNPLRRDVCRGWICVGVSNDQQSGDERVYQSMPVMFFQALTTQTRRLSVLWVCEHSVRPGRDNRHELRIRNESCCLPFRNSIFGD